MASEQKTQTEELAMQVMRLSRDDLLIHLRFFDLALANLKLEQRQMPQGPVTGQNPFMMTNGAVLFYDPMGVLKAYMADARLVARTLLHVLLHCVFFHGFQYEKLEPDIWDLATDIAVENVIQDMQLPGVALEEDQDRARKFRVLKEDCGALTAEKIYRYFRLNSPTAEEREEWTKLCRRDSHELWKPAEELLITQEQWKKISERVKADLKSFTKGKAGAETIEKNLEEATRDHYDYADILRRFTVTGEDMAVNDDEFDYIYYTYGLNVYGNVPLVEPLEYKELHKVKEFVIAIDTSASCRGSVVRAFLNKTYSILKGTENFFHKINVHIIQCDQEVQSDTKITCDDDFETFMKYGKLKGFGATDFRPVFTYVEQLREQGEFENLKGLIYFTDGYGIYPEKNPGYDVIFAFLEEDEHRMPVPPWALKVVIEDEAIEGNE
jgi:predicted metal-dependent peptidase